MNKYNHPQAAKLIYEILHTGCKISDDHGHTSVHSLYWVYKEAHGIFMRFIRSGKISEDTKIFFDANKSRIEQMHMNLNDPEEFRQTLTVYIRFYALPEDLSALSQGYKSPKKFVVKTVNLLDESRWVRNYNDGFLFWMNVINGIPIIVAARRDSESTLRPSFVMVANKVCFNPDLALAYYVHANAKPVLHPGFNWKNIITKRMQPWTKYIIERAYKLKAKWKPSEYFGGYTLNNQDEFSDPLYLSLQLRDNATLTVNHIWPLQAKSSDIQDLYNTIDQRFSQPPKMSKNSKNKQTRKIELKNFVVKGSVFRCAHNHHAIIDINATLKVLTKDYTLKSITVPAGYCSQCKLFFILNDTYQQILSRGTPVCTIIEYHTYSNHPKYYENQLNSWNAQSLLKIFGYSVSQSSNLSEVERHQILTTIMANGYLSKYQITSYLQKFISLHRGKSQDQSAIKKWKNDLHFVIGRSSSQRPSVGVKLLRITNSEKTAN